MNPDPQQLWGAAGIPFVLAVVQLTKTTFPTIPSNYWPALTLATAILWNTALAQFLLHTDLALAVFTGFTTGLGASGLYSWATNEIPGLKDRWSSQIISTNPK